VNERSPENNSFAELTWNDSPWKKPFNRRFTQMDADIEVFASAAQLTFRVQRSLLVLRHKRRSLSASI